MEGKHRSREGAGARRVGTRASRTIALLLSSALAVTGLTSVAIASSDANGQLTGCYQRHTGAVRLIKKGNLPQRCPRGTKPFTFNIRGPQGLPGPAGPAGSDGSPGAPGPVGPAGSAGAEGRTILHGSGAPAVGIGVDGDFYLDDAAYVLYGPKAGGAWPGAGVDLIGAAGADGADGATGPAGPAGAAGVDGTDGTDGADGSTILSGSGAPAAGTGVDGDFYLDTATWTLYGPKASGAWPGSGTSLVGPAGPGEDPVLIQVSDMSTQAIAVANALQAVTWSTTGAADGFVHVPGTDQVLVPRAGVYRITASMPMRRTGLLAPTSTATVCLLVNGVTQLCQSVGIDVDDLVHPVPLTAIVPLALGDAVTLRIKGTSTNVQLFGTADSTSVMTIASVD